MGEEVAFLCDEDEIYLHFELKGKHNLGTGRRIYKKGGSTESKLVDKLRRRRFGT